MDFNPFNNNEEEFNNQHNIYQQKPQNNNIIDELMNDINFNKNKNIFVNNNNEEFYNNKGNDLLHNVNNNFEKVNLNDNENNNKYNENIYDNVDNNNDFANPFKDNDNNIKEKENNNINFQENNNNINNNKNLNNEDDDDFTNPFKDYESNGPKPEQNNFSNPFSNENNNYNTNLNRINNNKIPDNNDNGEDDKNPYLDENNEKDDNDFSNPFKIDFGDKNEYNNNKQNNNFGNNFNNYQNNHGINNNINNNYQKYNQNEKNQNNNININKNNNNIFSYMPNNQNKNNINNFDLQEFKKNPYFSNVEFKNTNTSKDFKRIEDIIKKCESIFNTAKNNYENYYIKESIASLKKIISTLSSVRETINNKKMELSVFIPQIDMLENMAQTTLYNNRLNLYESINKKYKSINPKLYKNNESLIDFCLKLVLINPFISYDDIYNNCNMKEIFSNNIFEANCRKKKCILLYGDRGSGKTLLVHGYARKIGACVAQVEGSEIIKIQFFAREFVKVCFKHIPYNKPVFVYMKNIENMFSSLNQFDFIYDRIASSIESSIYFIASTNLDFKKLPKKIYDKFQFFQEVNTVETKNKSDFLKFICDKVDIKLNISLFDLNSFAYDYLDNFPNKKIYELVKVAINMKKEKNNQKDEPNWVYKEGLNLEDLKAAIPRINPYL